MVPYNFHFIVAVILLLLGMMVCCKTKQKRLVALFLTPVLFYCLFYDFNVGALGGVWPILRTYIAVPLFGFVYLFLTSVKSVDNGATGRISLRWIVLLFLMQGMIVLFVCSISWALETFPFANTDAILFTLFVGVNSGAEGFVVESFVWDALIPFVCVSFIILILQIFISFILKRKNYLKANFLWIQLEWNCKSFKDSFYNVQKICLLSTFVYCVVQAFALPGIMFSTPFRAFFQEPIDSQLYRDHYVFPDSVQIESKESYRNLILIFMESMETNFAQYTPEINSLADSAVNFVPGGVSLSGTSWTIAGIMGKVCGLPLSIPLSDNEYQGTLPTYLPKAQCLMDVLAKKGYSQTFMQGSSGDFTQKRKFWNVHGNVSVHDIEFYKERGMVPSDYRVFWGVEDRKLYDFAKKELDALADNDRPFALYMLTVDTHQPEGYVDDSCKVIFSDVDGMFPRALRCASRQLGDFIAWARKQPWYNETVIAVMGDHDMPMLSVKAHVPIDDSLRWVNFIINSSERNYQKRSYTSFDVFPTLLESMGFEVEGRSLGLGVSLFSNKKNILEIYGFKKLDSLLRLRSFQYDYFLMGREYW